MTDNKQLLEQLERRHVTLFLVAGGLLLIFAANTSARTFLGQSWQIVQSLIAPAGFLVGTLGLLSLISGLVGQAPKGARVAGLISGLTAVYWLVIMVGSIGDIVGTLPASEAIFPTVFFFGVYIATILAYVAVSVVSLYAGVYSKIVGVLVMGPAVMFLLLMARAAPPFIIDTGHALFHLGVGSILWSTIPSDRVEPTTDATANP